VIEQNNS
jgi:hypothetical protein